MNIEALDPPPAATLKLHALVQAEFAGQAERIAPGSGLPAHALVIPTANLILAVTPLMPRIFCRQMLKVAEARRQDVLLIRSGLHPESLNEVTIDIALTCGDSAPVLLEDLILYRGPDRRLWLVAPGDHAAVELRAYGLELTLAMPFASTAERAAGTCRAAAEIVRLMQARER